MEGLYWLMIMEKYMEQLKPLKIFLNNKIKFKISSTIFDRKLKYKGRLCVPFLNISEIKKLFFSCSNLIFLCKLLFLSYKSLNLIFLSFNNYLVSISISILSATALTGFSRTKILIIIFDLSLTIFPAHLLGLKALIGAMENFRV